MVNKPTVKLTEKLIPHTQSIEQPTFPIPVSSSSHDKIIPIPDYAVPQTRSRHDSSSRMLKSKTIQDIRREISMYQDPIYRPSPKPTEIPIQEVPRYLSNLDMDINTDIEENSHYQEGVISEMYQRLDTSYFQEPQ